MGNNTTAIILAAGLGKRMRSSLPKVLHPVAGLPMLAHVAQSALAAGCQSVVIVTAPDTGRRLRDVMTSRVGSDSLIFVTQQERLGTGDAARVGLEAVKNSGGDVLILCGDAPLVSSSSMMSLMQASRGQTLSLLTAMVPDPAGYGRILREDEHVVGIVEHTDATPLQREIREVNAGSYACSAAFLERAVGELSGHNAQGELYLTDMVAMAAQLEGARAHVAADFTEVLGVNNRVQLARAEAVYRDRRVAQLMAEGVSFLEPSSIWIDHEVVIEPNAEIGPGVVLRGQTTIHSHAILEGPATLRDTQVHPNAYIYAYSYLEGATVGEEAKVGPFARLRPGAVLDKRAKVGNFVELKKTRLGKGAKAGHLAYLGDTEIGSGANIGAGTITCNFDGTYKHKTKISDNVFVGSNTTLVAPVSLGDGAYVAAGSVITKDVPGDALAFGRPRQANREGYASRLKNRREKKD